MKFLAVILMAAWAVEGLENSTCSIEKSNGPGRSIQRHVGYSAPGSGVQTICYSQGTFRETRGNVSYVDGSFVQVNGNVCWIKGASEQGAICYVKGAVAAVNWTSSYDPACLVQETYKFEGSFEERNSSSNEPCDPQANPSDIEEGTLVFHGTPGLVQGNSCWIQGSKKDGEICYAEGKVLGAVCSLQYKIAYLLGDANSNPVPPPAPAPVQSPFQYKSSGLIRSAAGLDVPTSCTIQGSFIELGVPNYVSGAVVVVNGTNCWVRGTSESQEICWTGGVMRTLLRGNGTEAVCSVIEIYGHIMGFRYSAGVITAPQPACLRPAINDYYLHGTTIYSQGTSGLVQGDSCWIQSFQANGALCYILGTTAFIQGTLGFIPRFACYVASDFAYAIGIRTGSVMHWPL